MAQITLYAQGTMSWDTANGWNTAPGGESLSRLAGRGFIKREKHG